MTTHHYIKSPDSTQTIPFLDTSTPNMTRIFDYLSGGSANFEIDRQITKQMAELMPSLHNWVCFRRAFIAEAVPQLQADGFTQFLDLGSGMPSNDLIHTFADQATIIYSDINIVAISYGEDFFSKLPTVAYIFGDARNIAGIVSHAKVRQMFDSQQKVAIGLNALPLVLSPADMKRMVRDLFDWAAPGSFLFLVLQTRGDGELPDSYLRFIEITKLTGMPLTVYTLEQTLETLQPWQPILLEPITSFLGLPEDFITESDHENMDMTFHAVFLSKR